MADEPTPGDVALPAIQRRLATILSADVAGYSKMMGANEEATIQTLRGHRAVFDALLKQHRGRIFNTAGDAILAEFPSAVDAVRCATEIQTALQTRNEHLSPEQKLQFRMGINLGDVVVQDDGDLLGDGVNVASRIQTVAEPGGVCISGSVYDQIQNKLTLQFKPLGEQQFKNISQPIRTFTITHGERGALPARGRGFNARAAVVAGIAAAVAAVGAVGVAIYRFNESSRAEQQALDARIEKAAIEEARRTAEDQSRRAAEAELRAERERAAAEAARREAALQAQLQSAEDARRRAEADRKRLEDERQKAEAEKRTEARLEAEKRSTETARAEAAGKTAVAKPTEPSSPFGAASSTASARNGATAMFDGSYNGTICNFPNNPARRWCFNSSFKLVNGAADWSWLSRANGKRASARLTVAGDTSVSVDIDGWNVNDGSPLAGVMSGRASDNGIDAHGRWANGAPVEAHWTRAQ